MSGKGRLRFKGDIIEKKKKKSKKRRLDGSDEKDDHSGPPDGNESAWVAAERITDLSGPAFFYQYVKQEDGESSRPYCIALNPALHRVEAHPIKPPAINDSVAAHLDLEGAEIVQDAEGSTLMTPSDITQVWVATRILDTPSSAPRYSLRSSEGRFVSSSKDGTVTSYSEARGPLEEFTLIEASKEASTMFRIQSANNTLLEVDIVAGGKMVVRSDQSSQTPTSTGTWNIAVQWKFREAARKREEGEKPLRERDTSFKRVKET